MKKHGHGKILLAKPILLVVVLTFAVGTEFGCGQASVSENGAHTGKVESNEQNSTNRANSSEGSNIDRPISGDTQTASLRVAGGVQHPSFTTNVVPNETGEGLMAGSLNQSGGGTVTGANTSGSATGSNPDGATMGSYQSRAVNTAWGVTPNNSGIGTSPANAADSQSPTQKPSVNINGDDMVRTVVEANSHGITVYNVKLRPVSRAFRYAEEVTPSDYYYFCLSIVSCVIAFFLLYQSIALQRMLTKGRENAPGPNSGAGVSWLLFLLLCGICCFYWIANAQAQTGLLEPLDFFHQDWWGVIVQSPRPFAYMFLIASAAPGIIAIYKFVFSFSWVLFRHSRKRPMSQFAPNASLNEVDSALDRIEQNVNELKTKISSFESGYSMSYKAIKGTAKIDSTIGNILAVAILFLAVHIGISWIVADFSGRKIGFIVVSDFVVMTLVLSFVLRRFGKLSEESYKQVIWQSFKLIPRLFIDIFRGARTASSSETHSDESMILSDSESTKMEVTPKAQKGRDVKS